MKHFFIFFVIGVFLSSCAIMSAPDGGPKDEIPPVIISSFPANKSTEFSAKEITITFDEYFTVQNFSTQFFTSPPLKYPVKQRIKGKTLLLSIEDTLASNTTYTFSFGNSIKDISEGNVQSDFKYVFSTGTVLDSLKIAGTVLNAYTGLPEEGMIAMLYRPAAEDSAIFKNKPNYYALTDKQGNFSIENLGNEPFILLAIKDENLNQTYNPGLEKVAFHTEPVLPASTENITIRAFSEKTEVRMIDAKQLGFGQIVFVFSEKISNPKIQVLGTSEQKKATELVCLNAKSDTVTFWYNPNDYDKDLRELYFSVHSNEIYKDSVRVNLKELKANPLKITLSTPKIFSINDSIVFSTNLPIAHLDARKIEFKTDTALTAAAVLQRTPTRFTVDFRPSFKKTYQLKLQPEALTDIFGNTSDSTIFNLESAAEDELAIVHLVIIASDFEPKIAELINDKGKTARTYFFTDRLAEDLMAMPPGKYGLRIIWDNNENQVWDVGDYLQKIQPEKVMYYPKPIELRANWEVETIWEMPENAAIKDVP